MIPELFTWEEAEREFPTCSAEWDALRREESVELVFSPEVDGLNYYMEPVLEIYSDDGSRRWRWDLTSKTWTELT